MTLLEQWQDLAEIENSRAREMWDDMTKSDNAKRRTYSSKTVDGLRPLLGTGITQREAARRIGVTPGTVSNMLRKHGWTL